MRSVLSLVLAIWSVSLLEVQKPVDRVEFSVSLPFASSEQNFQFAEFADAEAVNPA